MNLLSLEQAQKSYGEKVLLKQANFYLNEGEKVGIIGINGTGKTTLLRILAGTEVPDEGSRTVANHVVLRFLEQNPQMPADMSVLEYVLQGEKEEERWILEPDAKTLLMTFELNDFNQPCGQLSGGQKKRAALAKTLLRPADILILDEPTNHLDTKMADWLEDYLRRYRGAMIMVTHDRYFLDQVTNRITELDHASLYSYETNYSGYLQKKAEREQNEDSAAAKRKNLLRTELEWLNRGHVRVLQSRRLIFSELKICRSSVDQLEIALCSLTVWQVVLERQRLRWKAWQVAILDMSAFMIFLIFF